MFARALTDANVHDCCDEADYESGAPQLDAATRAASQHEFALQAPPARAARFGGALRPCAQSLHTLAPLGTVLLRWTHERREYVDRFARAEEHYLWLAPNNATVVARWLLAHPQLIQLLRMRARTLLGKQLAPSALTQAWRDALFAAAVAHALGAADNEAAAAAAAALGSDDLCTCKPLPQHSATTYPICSICLQQSD